MPKLKVHTNITDMKTWKKKKGLDEDTKVFIKDGHVYKVVTLVEVKSNFTFLYRDVLRTLAIYFLPNFFLCSATVSSLNLVVISFPL